MVAYSFRSQFIEPIRAGTKGGTIRAERKPGTQLYAKPRPGGHALVGETLQLYCGMRTRQCFLIDYKVCVAVEPIILNFITDSVLLGRSSTRQVIQRGDSLDAFARFDGFESWLDLAAFWRATHGNPTFDGWSIRWLPLPSPLP